MTITVGVKSHVHQHFINNIFTFRDKTFRFRLSENKCHSLKASAMTDKTEYEPVDTGEGKKKVIS